MILFKSLLDKPVDPSLESMPPTLNTEEIIKRDKESIWKLKGMAAHTTYRMFSKYGNKRFVDKEWEDFSTHFVDTYAEGLLQSHMTLFFRRTTNFIGTKTLNHAIKFITACIKVPKTMAIIKPQATTILL